MRILLALSGVMLRQLLRNRQSVFFVLAMPLVILALLSATGAVPADFLAPGVTGLALLGIGLLTMPASILHLRDKGVFRKLQLAPVSKLHFLGAQALVGALLALPQAALVWVVGAILGVRSLPVPAWQLAGTVLAGGLAFSLLGFGLSSLAANAEAAVGLANLLNLPMAFLGGVFFPLDGVPGIIRGAARVLPLTGFVNLLRGNPDPTARIEAWAVLGLWALAGLVLGLRFFRWQSRSRCS